MTLSFFESELSQSMGGTLIVGAIPDGVTDRIDGRSTALWFGFSSSAPDAVGNGISALVAEVDEIASAQRDRLHVKTRGCRLVTSLSGVKILRAEVHPMEDPRPASAGKSSLRREVGFGSLRSLSTR